MSADPQGTESSSGLSVYARCCGVYSKRGQAPAPLDEDLIFLVAKTRYSEAFIKRLFFYFIEEFPAGYIDKEYICNKLSKILPLATVNTTVDLIFTEFGLDRNTIPTTPHTPTIY